MNGGNLGVEEALREHGGGMGQGVVVGLLPAKIRGRWPLGFLGSVETEMGRVVGCNVSPTERRQLWRCVEEVVMSGNVNVGL